jgi:hypothetical protein
MTVARSYSSLADSIRPTATCALPFPVASRHVDSRNESHVTRSDFFQRMEATAHLGPPLTQTLHFLWISRSAPPTSPHPSAPSLGTTKHSEPLAIMSQKCTAAPAWRILLGGGGGPWRLIPTDHRACNTGQCSCWGTHRPLWTRAVGLGVVKKTTYLVS